MGGDGRWQQTEVQAAAGGSLRLVGAVGWSVVVELLACVVRRAWHISHMLQRAMMGASLDHFSRTTGRDPQVQMGIRK